MKTLTITLMLALFVFMPIENYAQVHKNYTAQTQPTAEPEDSVETPKMKYTISGHIRDVNGETLINATVYDMISKQGTTSNEFGLYSITLPEGEHKLRISYIGFLNRVEDIELTEDTHLNITLKENAKLGEIIISRDLNSPLLNTQTGKHSYTAKDLAKEYSLLSSPDVIKTLQRSSGVHEGVELVSGLYVHGGNNDENLFLLDGTPLYQINHSLGLFSSFNTNVIKNIDFYKSDFPARYGGRLSSVVDVRTKEGDMKHWHGEYRIGLLDGSFQIDGPIQPGKTSFNFGIRRSWVDLLTTPIFAIRNRGEHEDENSGSFNFYDVNAKFTHVFSQRSKVSLSFYYGDDKLKILGDSKYVSGTITDKEHSNVKFKWGNFNTALDWNYVLSPKLFANFTAIYSYNRSIYNSKEDYLTYNGSSVQDQMHFERGYRSTINDYGYRMEFDYRPIPKHHIRFGNNYTYHIFTPQNNSSFAFFGYANPSDNDTIQATGTNHHRAHEVTLYAEDEMAIDSHWKANFGINADIFNITGKTFVNIDPRLAVRYLINDIVSLKMSYTIMTQYVHRISNTYIDMPTDNWVPTTKNLNPMRSKQLSFGAYADINTHWALSLECYSKWSSHLLQSTNWIGLEPPTSSWDENVIEGKGRFYGVELDATYKNENIIATASYTLSWNKRYFPDYYEDWFYDKFDNRHKLNLSVNYKLNNHTNVYAAWVYHSGNRMTVATQYAQMPNIPDGSDYGIWYGTDNRGFVYEKPNNVSLPAYHRLDIGCDFHKITKRGHERIWNISVYNAYCHINTLYARIRIRKDGTLKPITQGFFPIIPSCSYTIKF